MEACSAFARLAEARAAPAPFLRLRRELDASCIAWEIVQVDERIVRLAGDFCAQYRLRGYDSVHLAAAGRVHGAIGTGADFRFGAFDPRLVRAAGALGLNLLET